MICRAGFDPRILQPKHRVMPPPHSNLRDNSEWSGSYTRTGNKNSPSFVCLTAGKEGFMISFPPHRLQNLKSVKLVAQSDPELVKRTRFNINQRKQKEKNFLPFEATFLFIYSLNHQNNIAIILETPKGKLVTYSSS